MVASDDEAESAGEAGFAKFVAGVDGAGGGVVYVLARAAGVRGDEITLELRRELAEIVPEAGEVGEVCGVEGLGEGAGEVGNFCEVLLKGFPV